MNARQLERREKEPNDGVRVQKGCMPIIDCAVWSSLLLSLCSHVTLSSGTL